MRTAKPEWKAYPTPDQVAFQQMKTVQTAVLFGAAHTYLAHIMLPSPPPPHNAGIRNPQVMTTFMS